MLLCVLMFGPDTGPLLLLPSQVMGQTGICGHGLCESQMNVNKEMMTWMLLLCLLCSVCVDVWAGHGTPAAALSTGYGPALTSCSRPVCFLEDFASGSASVPTNADGHLQA